MSDDIDVTNVQTQLVVKSAAERADDTARETKAVTVAQAIPWLRTQAETARNTTVTQGNAVAVLGALVTNVGKFYDRFADFLEAQRFDQR